MWHMYLYMYIDSENSKIFSAAYGLKYTRNEDHIGM